MVHLTPNFEYPPQQHLLRDIAVDIEQVSVGRSNGWIPMQASIRSADGRGRIGAVTTLIDCVGGAVAGPVVAPGWMATADLSLEYFGSWTEGWLRAEGRTLRAGRSTVVIVVELYSEINSQQVGRGHLTFAVLPRRDHNPVMEGPLPEGRRSLGSPGCEHSILDAMHLRLLGNGVVECPCDPYHRNTLGAMHGGSVALIADAAAEHAVLGDDMPAGSRSSWHPTALSLTYFARLLEGPANAVAQVSGVLGSSREVGVALADVGGGRRTATAWVRGTLAGPPA